MVHRVIAIAEPLLASVGDREARMAARLRMRSRCWCRGSTLGSRTR
jgi:hypothetical protein